MALCLSRKVGETLRIGEAVVRFTRVVGGRVLVAIDAPRNVVVVRGECGEASALLSGAVAQDGGQPRRE